MSKLRLSIAMGNYDRTRALVDGEVTIDGADPIYMMLSPEEMFFRSFRDVAFDVSELSLSSFALKTADGSNPYIGIPVFPSRAFRHTSIHVRSDRGIDGPPDLKGRRLGTPEYQLTANVWARALLQDEYGVAPSDVIWVRGGMEHPGRREKISLHLPPDIRIEEAPDDLTLSQMLERGDIDGIVGPRARPPAGPLAVHRPRARRGAIFPANANLPHHARPRDSARARRAASVAADGALQGIRRCQGHRRGAAHRHFRHEGDTTLRGGAAARRACAAGVRLLVLRSRAQPSCTR
jgi:4,5-dihydroxyphthalate decarboxylase